MRLTLCAALVLLVAGGASSGAVGSGAAGHTLAVQGTAGGRTAIYVLEDGVLRKLPAKGHFTGEPTWSPGGREIGFTSDRASGGTGGDVYVMNAGGGDVAQLTFNSFDEHDPAWAPKGDRIAFAGDQGVNVTATDGSVVTKITAETPLRGPTWRPDGRRLAFSSGPNARLHSPQIYVVNLNGTGLRKLTDLKNGAIEPDWSPNGRSIVFAVGKPGELYVMGSDGGPVRRLTRTRAAEHTPAWSADGRSIVFMRAGAIWSMPTSGGTQRLLLARPGITFDRPDPSPAG